MAIELNHTIVAARDKQASAAFLTEILGLPPARPFYHLLVVRTANGVSLDYMECEEPFEVQHYAFLVSDAEFDDIFGRVTARGLTYWADPRKQRPNQINTDFGGRGFYFEDPSGHYLEVLTRPYEVP